ncbi:DMT family transporter [Corynebacterium sp. 35RC1]|nr:DMT family transporter [Corynebacterium sp. 35RC1]
MHSNFLAVVLALASALTIAWGTVIRHAIAEHAGTGKVMRSAIKRPQWWFGSATAMVGYALQVAALAFGTLLVVQPILVLSLMFTLPLAAKLAHRRMHNDEIFWSIVLTVAVGVLVVLGNPTAGDPQPDLSRWLPALGVGSVLISATFFWAKNRRTNTSALMLGIATGALYGYVAVLSKATVDIFVHFGVPGLLRSWEGYLLVVGAVLGTVIQQYAFNAGALKNSLPAMTVAEPIVAFALGYVVLGEQFQVSGWNWAYMAVALVLMVAGTFALSRREIGAA